MMKRLAALVVLASACGPTRFEPFCEQSAAAGCRQLFRCDPDSAKTVFGDVSGCVSQLQQQTKCSSFADAACELDGSKTATCLRDIENAACSTRPGDLPSSCSELTCGGSGSAGIRCMDSSSTFVDTGCSNTRSNCSDSNTYAVRCSGDTCTCVKNGQEERSFAGSCGLSSAERRSQYKSECGYELD